MTLYFNTAIHYVCNVMDAHGIVGGSSIPNPPWRERISVMEGARMPCPFPPNEDL